MSQKRCRIKNIALFFCVIMIVIAACSSAPSRPTASVQPAVPVQIELAQAVIPVVPAVTVSDELDGAIQVASDYLNKNIPNGSKLVILNFRSDYPPLSEYIIDVLTGFIVNERSLTVVDRANLTLIQQEMDFQQSGEVSDSSAQSIGQKLGAQTIVSGSITAFGDLWRLSVRALDVESAQVQGQFNRNMSSGPTIAALTSGPALVAAANPISPGSAEKAGQTPAAIPAQSQGTAQAALPDPPVPGVSSSSSANNMVSETTNPAPAPVTAAQNATTTSPAVQTTQPAQTSSAPVSPPAGPPLIAGFVWINEGTFMMGSSPATDPGRTSDELIHR
ncbi:MAG: hypothetical protein LBL13_05685, partial [Bacteroidales bacterium]|nr:hypothetical protein [Bacteroidales bacterium]